MIETEIEIEKEQIDCLLYFLSQNKKKKKPFNQSHEKKFCQATETESVFSIC